MTQDNLGRCKAFYDLARQAESRCDFQGAFEWYSQAPSVCPEENPRRRLILNGLMDDAEQLASEAERQDHNQAVSWYAKALEIASTLATTPLYAEFSEAYEGRKRLYQVRLDELRGLPKLDQRGQSNLKCSRYLFA